VLFGDSKTANVRSVVGYARQMMRPAVRFKYQVEEFE